MSKDIRPRQEYMNRKKSSFVGWRISAQNRVFARFELGVTFDRVGRWICIESFLSARRIDWVCRRDVYRHTVAGI